MIQEFVKTYSALADAPKLKSGKILKLEPTPTIQLVTQQQDPKDNGNITLTKVWNGSMTSFPCSTNDVAYFSNISPSGKYTIMFKDIQVDPKRNRVAETRLELWNMEKRLFSVGCKDIHGKVYTEGSIQNLSWNSDETKILYIAEKKEEEKKKYFEEIKKDVTPVYDFYEYKEDFGEMMNEKSSPRLYELDILTRKVVCVEGIPEKFGVLQPSYAPGGIVFVGQDLTKRRLGLRFCIQRESFLYFLGKELVQLAKDEWNVHCPRFSPDFKTLLWLTTGKVRVHESSEKIKVMDWDTKEIREVKTSIPLYPDATLAWNAYSGSTLIVESSIRTSHSVCIVEIESGRVEPIPSDASVLLVDIKDNHILVNIQSPMIPYHVVLLKLDGLNVVSSTLVDEDTEVSELLKDVTWKVDKANEIEYIVVSPKNVENLSVIVNPHGGPHGCSTTIFRLETLCFALHGYAVLCPNYRGSLGYSQEFVEVLPGHVGDYDIQDVQITVNHFVTKNNVAKDRVFYSGGSHGGFIGGHLIGQFPHYYKAAILHNPVINLSSMVGTSDIPDWVFTEVGYDPYTNEIITSEFNDIAFKMSPMYYVKNVKTPTLLLIGDVDRRVPPEQGKQFYEALRRQGVDTKMLVYKDQAHSIADPAPSIDRVVSSLLWFDKHK